MDDQTPAPELKTETPLLPAPPEIPELPRPKSNRKWLVILLLVLLLLAGAGTYWFVKMQPKSQTTAPQATTTTATEKQTPDVAGLKLDPTKNYGDKYANGMLPVGDKKYMSDAAKKGYVYTCTNYAKNLASDQAGADKRGPWFMNNNTEYDLNKKSKVQGSVTWKSSLSINVANGIRTITSNDLPNHVTGTFPVSKTDPAYAYDRNPNTISGQSLNYALPATPTYGDPTCIGGEVGIMTTGVALFNGFDAGGRDAGAWEVQDGCGGHPQNKGEYHYHTLSSCITDIGVSKIIGFALDGFPITGPKVGDKNILTTSDLDECHGIVSEVELDGKKVTTYHYVMTQDFPYSISCYRAKAIQTGPPEGGQPPR